MQLMQKGDKQGSLWLCQPGLQGSTSARCSCTWRCFCFS